MDNIFSFRLINSRILTLIADKDISPYHLMKEFSIPKKSFYRYINSERDWPVEHLINIARYFGVSLDYLLLGDTNNKYLHKESNKLISLEKENELLREQLMVMAQNIPAEILAKAFKDANKTEGK